MVNTLLRQTRWREKHELVSFPESQHFRTASLSTGSKVFQSHSNSSSLSWIRLNDRGWVREKQLTINELSAVCQANIATLKSQLPEHVPEALQKLEDFFIEPLIVLDGMHYQGFNFTPSLYDEPNDLIIIRNMLTGIVEFTQKDPGISTIEYLDTEVLGKLDWLRDSLLRCLNRRAGHFDCNHRLPEPDSQFLRSKYESLRNHVQHQILQEKWSGNIQSHGFNALQRRLIDGILLRKDRFERARAHHKTVMGTWTMESKSQEQSRFKSPVQAELTLDKFDFPERPCLTRNDPYRTCPCCFQSISEREVQKLCEWINHVAENLHLYTCVVEDCSEGDRLFSTRKSLWAHLQTLHSKWACSFCDASFDESSKLRLHLDDNHKSQLGKTDDLSPEYHLRVPFLDLRSCPLCSFTPSEDSCGLVTHVINHMTWFSSKFKPWIETYDEAGEAPEDSGTDSKAGH
ncbi:hypothetical protein V2G26_008681 [Clonostachys chloroleuca]